MRHQRVFISVWIISPRSFAELIDGYNSSRIAVERQQYIVFFCSQREMFIFFYHFGTVKVNLAPSKLDDRIFAFVVPPQNDSDTQG